MDSDKRRRGGSLKQQTQKPGIRALVERLDLKKALADEKTVNSLRNAGYRGQNPLTMFLFLRFVLPFAIACRGGDLYFCVGKHGRTLHGNENIHVLVVAYAGFYAPNLYISNRASKRKFSIQRAWPDALDLMLICVESGMSVEVGIPQSLR